MGWAQHQERQYQEVVEASSQLRVAAREAEQAFEHAEEEFYRVTAARSRLYQVIQSMHAWHPVPMYQPPWPMWHGGWSGYVPYGAPGGYARYAPPAFAAPAPAAGPESLYGSPSVSAATEDAAPAAAPQNQRLSPTQQASRALQNAQFLQPAQQHRGLSIPQPSAHPTWGPVTPLLSRWEEGIMTGVEPAFQAAESSGERLGFDHAHAGRVVTEEASEDGVTEMEARYNAAPQCLAHSLSAGQPHIGQKTLALRS
ncbi:hypothetical protein C8A05DRAFT_30001 [Staphylotrichum tortipilum]|uniref:Uncharacterized protein n=1 Tax=Staphylotrichum tortipilum TaxID=2831512 RepID=A0AAN6RXJ6_9PEZI|nr:hypothetical protein C8A05DRAFT_30001 [Staphylotrichum longicolle]